MNTFDQIVYQSAPKKTFRFHLLGVPYVPTHKRYTACPFSSGMINLSQMLLAEGHQVYLYSAESSDCPCTEFIQTHTLADLRQAFGETDYQGDEPLGYNWRQKGWKRYNQQLTKIYTDTAVREINKRKKNSDFLLISVGTDQKAVADGVKIPLMVEYSIGYPGCFAPYKAFVSSCLRYLVHGKMNKDMCKTPSYYERVIPNCFNAEEFTFLPETEKDDYFLFIGRLFFNKGVTIAYQTCKILKKRLIIVGQGWQSWDPKSRLLVLSDGQRMTLPDYMDFQGYADLEKRQVLLSKAKAVFTPTLYVEPFGNTVVESYLSGTPVITTNYGGFTETVEQGKTGYRCDTMNDYVQAVRLIESQPLDSEYIRDRAIRLYSMDNVKWQYLKWFYDLHDLFHAPGGWSYIRPIEEQKIPLDPEPTSPEPTSPKSALPETPYKPKESASPNQQKWALLSTGLQFQIQNILENGPVPLEFEYGVILDYSRVPDLGSQKTSLASFAKYLPVSPSILTMILNAHPDLTLADYQFSCSMVVQVTGITFSLLMSLLAEEFRCQYISYYRGALHINSEDSLTCQRDLWLEQSQKNPKNPAVLVSGLASFEFDIRLEENIILTEDDHYYVKNSPSRDQGFFRADQWFFIQSNLEEQENKQEDINNSTLTYYTRPEVVRSITNPFPTKKISSIQTATEVLMLGPIYLMRNKTSTNYCLFFEYLMKHLNSPLIKFVPVDLAPDGELAEPMPIEEIVAKHCQTDRPIIYVWDIPGLNLVSDLAEWDRSIKVFDIQDTHRPELPEMIKKHGFDVCVYKYHPYQMPDKNPKMEFLETEHYIDPEKFRDHEQEKTQDVFCYGNSIPNYYPFRHRLYKLLDKTEDLKVKILPHPGYGTNHNFTKIVSVKHKVKENELSKMINQSKMTVCTSMYYDWFLAKYIEGTLSGSLIVGNIPKNGVNISKFRDCIVEVNQKMTDEQILEKIKYFVDHEEERIAKIKKNQEIVNKYFTYDRGVRKHANLFHYLREKNEQKNK